MVMMAITTIVDNDERLLEGYLHTSRECAEAKPHLFRGWNSLAGKAQPATGKRVLRCRRQRVRRSVDSATGRPQRK